MDWSKTALGPVETWPQSLRTSVSLCLSSTFPILIAWGPETIQIYNDSYRPICGAKHPESMGQNFRICWETALPVVGDKFTRGQQGEGTYIKDQRMFLDRYGYLEEAFMTFSFAPIRDESGNVGGIFHPITETTDKMLSARRTQVLRELGSQTSKAKSLEEIRDVTIKRYDDFKLDLPFILIYQVNADGTAALLSGAAGLPVNTPLTPPEIDLTAPGNTWPLHEAQRTRGTVNVTGLTSRFGAYTCEPYEQAPENALVLPLYISGQDQPFGFLVTGVSACRALDQEYENFYELLVNTYNTAVSNVYAYEQEQKRAEALAAIDRSKTEFFSNVSHEFRTPLTLMLGPLEELKTLPLYNNPAYRGNIESAHGNALRLLRLVNNLLDFSRVEADRVKAMYQPVDLTLLTADLASSFRSIIEKAGMDLLVSCRTLREPVYVDREMWEKIVLNLLSNAFKYTLQGAITVSLAEVNQHVVLTVSDTGVGIPAHELPHMFERFHRVSQSLGRTHEGTGIGLSLVHELTALHGGNITVESTEGQGSTFTVTIPFGKRHLPQELVSDQARVIDTTILKGAFLKEANMLLNENGQPAAVADDGTNAEPSSYDPDTHILIVDDNNDMRDYLTRLIAPHFAVQTARHGAAALESIALQTPDLIISDIMMPVMDGKALLAALKGDPKTATIPLIFLSARAGEEARIDGLEAGADDYLIKPFSAKELMSKIRRQIRKSKAQEYAEQQLRNLVIQAPVAIAIYRGPDYRISIANDMILGIWNKTAGQVLDKPLFEAVPELAGQGFEELMDAVYHTGNRVITGDRPVSIMHGNQLEEIYINVTIEPMRKEDQSISGLMVVATEVTDLVTARIAAQNNAEEFEKKVVQRTKELSDSNQELTRINTELEQYIYITSHDLQEPLRKIQVFGGMLESQPGLPESATSILGKIIKSSDRLTRLINDLITFSHLRKTDNDLEAVDLNAVLAHVSEDFELVITEKNAVIESGILPTIPAVRLQITQLFYNLLSNALKFSQPDVRPLVTIKARALTRADFDSIPPQPQGDSFYEITVRDNGVGFDNRFAGQVFQIFKRLHSAQQYTGSGIGLAICHRIVQNHGGIITAESQPGQGTTIRVVLPVKRMVFAA